MAEDPAIELAVPYMLAPGGIGAALFFKLPWTLPITAPDEKLQITVRLALGGHKVMKLLFTQSKNQVMPSVYTNPNTINQTQKPALG